MVAAAEQAPGSQPKAKIFVSYSRRDMAFVDRLEEALRAREFDPLIDRAEIYAFEDWWKRIETLIGRADTVVFVLSPNAVTSEIALKEVFYAGSLNKRFAPIVCQPVEHNKVPEALRRLNFIFFDDPKHFDASADTLAEALQTDIGWIRRHTEFGEAARRWVGAGRPSGLLLHPPLLEEAEFWITYHPHGAPLPSSDTETFIAASRKAEIERSQAEASAKVSRRRMQGAIYTMLIAIIAGLIGWINQEYIVKRWRWYVTERPFMTAEIRPFVLAGNAEQTLKPKDTFRECVSAKGTDYCPQMVVIQAGSFTMGSPPTENNRKPDEGPQHTVTIKKPFAVSRFEVTFDEWDTCVAYGACNPVSDSNVGRGRQPVFNVNWNDAKSYVAWLSKMTGKPYRLLSEAEYEYATRAGTQTVYPWGDDIGVNNADCDGCGSRWDNRQSAQVGSFAANGFGLYDMVGNVREWVEDCYHASYGAEAEFKELAPTDGSAWTSGLCYSRVVRSGSWRQGPAYIRSASRDRRSTDIKGGEYGFRIGRTLFTP